MKQNRLKNSARLQQIELLINEQYTHIWDCCCDHGLLGFNLLNARVAETIHFVDIVPSILAELKGKLEKHWQGAKASWQVHCIDVNKLPINQYRQNIDSDKHLIIIAGVGGELLIEFMNSLLAKTANSNVEFILCPVHHNYKVRNFLINNNIGLIDERLVVENNRFYEILHVSANASQVISRVGDKMWDLSNPLHQQYLHKNIKHYQRIACNPVVDVSDIINSYQVLVEIC